MSESSSLPGSSRDRRDRAERLYEQARLLAVEQREKFITDSCPDDDVLREDLANLLAYTEPAESLFRRLADALVIDRLTPGVIADRYEIRACIGVGGMGAVYRAHDLRLQRDVALKFLPPDFAPTSRAGEALLQEARAVAAIEHPNVCTVHEIASTEDGRPFISMAFYDGETLKERLKRGAIPPSEAVDICRQLARGLAAAHAQALVHRDVKPGNVMLLRDGTVKLLDFGLAGLADVTGPGPARGTVVYMSPEQIRGAGLDARSDLFSLGITMHEMVAGVHPFRGASSPAVLQAILHEHPEPLRSVAPHAPASLERIVSCLLDKSPGARYADASALIADLDALSVTAATPSAKRAWAPSARAWRWAAAALIIFAAGAAALSVSQRSAGLAQQPQSVGAPGDASSALAGTIAVLPFVNLKHDPADDYLVDGLTEELIVALSQVRTLRVVARTSAFAFRDTRRDVREIGRTLGVGAILEGSVQRNGDRIRVRARLVNVSDGLDLWSEAYDREMTDIFAIQRDLALRIASALRAGLSPAERERVSERRTGSAEAYGFYLKGRHFWNQRTSSGFVRAIEYYRRAVEADPQFAAAWAGLAGVYSQQGLAGDLPSAAARERMRVVAYRAVELDDLLSEAHSVLGVYLHVYEWDAEAAEREQLRAIGLDPGYVTARYFYANLLRVHGRFDEAIAQYRAAAELDPLDPLISVALGRTLILAGRLGEARQHILEAIELDSMSARSHAELGALHEASGELNEALRAYRRALELGGSTADVARLLARTGREREAREILGQLQAQQAATGIHDPDVALTLYALHDADGAMEWLEQAYRERHPMLRFIAGQPEYVLLEADPRYIDLLRRIGVRR